MNSRITSVSEALELLVPPFEQSSGDWDEIVRRAGHVTQTRRLTRRRALAAAVAGAVLTILFATPAFGLLVDLIGRTNVPFAGKAAPLEVKRNFYDLGLGAPPSMAHAIVSQTRQVATVRYRGKTHVLYVAPTRDGGYCWQLSHAFGGCRRARDLGTPLGVTYQTTSRNGADYVSFVAGDLVAPAARSLVVRFSDGSERPIRFYYVSKPIDAGFFVADIRAGRKRAVAVVLRDGAGHVLGRQAFLYLTPAQIARRQARAKAMLQRLKRQHRLPPTYSTRPLPAPTAPLQRGEASGVTVVAGRNGVVVFDLSGASAKVRPLISGRSGYDCFRRLPYHSAPVGLGGYPHVTGSRVAIRVNGVSPPFLGCEIQGSYGHRWPDRNGSHSAVEIAFTPAAQTYFADRAAARDLALFLRSKRMHELRKLAGGALAAALRDRYGAAVAKLDSTSATLPPGRVGYLTEGSATTYAEWSTTGGRFYVRVDGGRIRGQNVKPLAFVF